MRTLIIVLLATLVCPAALGQGAPRPNILFLFADDHRPDAIGAAGNPHIQTPQIDALAGRGFRFGRNYCMGSIHGAVCQPSRAMLNTGRTLYRVKMDMAGAPTLGETLRQAGYQTFGTGKWHNGRESFLRSFECGRNIMFGGMSDHLRIAVEGMRFVNAYSMPKCTPTRVTLLTGQYPYRHGWVNHWVPCSDLAARATVPG
ncbi:MAG: sulfatase-like hydrolase/transferase [Planctomycetota bacterium]|jgi:arylsulfatase A-like enzyme